MDEQKHTNLPWEVIKLRRETDSPIVLCSVEAVDKEFIADSQLDACEDEETRQRAIANMEFIILACNSFYEMREALLYIINDENAELTTEDYNRACAAVLKASKKQDTSPPPERVKGERN